MGCRTEDSEWSFRRRIVLMLGLSQVGQASSEDILDLVSLAAPCTSRLVIEIVPLGTQERARILDESLPAGLQIRALSA